MTRWGSANLYLDGHQTRHDGKRGGPTRRRDGCSGSATTVQTLTTTGFLLGSGWVVAFFRPQTATGATNFAAAVSLTTRSWRSLPPFPPWLCRQHIFNLRISSSVRSLPPTRSSLLFESSACSRHPAAALRRLARSDLPYSPSPVVFPQQNNNPLGPPIPNPRLNHPFALR
jgi:hypothetical protein